MEHPHDPYHVRPFPQQPHRGGKEFKKALEDLETTLSSDLPDFEAIGDCQKKVHQIANTFNDDRLIDQIRQLSHELDAYLETPDKELKIKAIEQLLKIKVELKHL